jgi:hypothetical protein
MKINIDYTNVHLHSSDLETIVEWGKEGPIVFSNYKLRRFHNYNINELVEEIGINEVIDFLYDIKEKYSSKYHQIQINEIIKYIKEEK